MKPLPRIPFPLIPAGVTVAMVLYACGQNGPGFGPGGSSHDDSKIPDPVDTNSDDTGGDTAVDSFMDDTGFTDDTGDTSPPVDTSPPFDGEGYDRGDIAYNLLAPDNLGGYWNLYHQIDRPIVIVLGYAQSYTFQDICTWLPDIESEFASYGLETAVMLYLDPAGVDADFDDATAWASYYGLSNVLFDPDHTVRGSWSTATQVKTFLIDGDMVIQWNNSEATSQEQLRQEIGDLVY
jgi:hypothetical protein